MLQNVVDRLACQIWYRAFTTSVISGRVVLSDKVIRDNDSRISRITIEHGSVEAAVSGLQDLGFRERQNGSYRNMQDEDAESYASNSDTDAPIDMPSIETLPEDAQFSLTRKSALCPVSISGLPMEGSNPPGDTTESASRSEGTTDVSPSYMHDLCPAEHSPCPACIGRSVLVTEAHSEELGKLESQVMKLNLNNQRLESALESQSEQLRQQISVLESEVRSKSESLDQVRSREVGWICDNSRLRSKLERKEQEIIEHVSQLVESIDIGDGEATHTAERHQGAVKNEVRTSQSTADRLESQIASLENDIQDMQAEIESLRRRLETLTAFSKRCAATRNRLYADLLTYKRELRKLRSEVLNDKNSARRIFTELAVLQITLRRNLGLVALGMLRRWAKEEMVEMSDLRPEEFDEIYQAHLDAIDTEVEHDMIQSSTARFQDFSFKLIYPFFNTTRAKGICHKGMNSFADPSDNDGGSLERLKRSDTTESLPDLLSDCALEETAPYNEDGRHDVREGDPFADDESGYLGDSSSGNERSGLLKGEHIDRSSENDNDADESNDDVNSNIHGSTHRDQVHTAKVGNRHYKPETTSSMNVPSIHEASMPKSDENASSSSSISIIQTPTNAETCSLSNPSPAPASSSSCSSPFISIGPPGLMEDTSSDEDLPAMQHYHRFPSLKKGKLRCVNP